MGRYSDRDLKKLLRKSLDNKVLIRHEVTPGIGLGGVLFVDYVLPNQNFRKSNRLRVTFQVAQWTNGLWYSGTRAVVYSQRGMASRVKAPSWFQLELLLV